MRKTLRHCSSILAAVLLSCALPAVAGQHGDDGDGPPATKPGNGGGNGHGPPTTPPGDSGHTKIHGPQGTCAADDGGDGIDVQGPDGQSGASRVAHTNFALTDPATGEAVVSPASAAMMYFWYGSTFDYVVNAHGLPAGSQWTLTYQAEPLPSPGAICLGSGTVDAGGQLHLAHSIELGSNLPPALDPGGDPSTQPQDALLALVPGADVDCAAGAMTTFEPALYLWTNPRVRFVDTDLLPAVPATP